MTHHRVTPTGQALGKNAARLAELGRARLESLGLADVKAPKLRDEMCKSCAFLPGTVPNGCLQTQMDALKAVLEDVPFMCHQANRKGAVCHGWYAARYAIDQRALKSGQQPPITKCPWEFSPTDEEAV